MQVFHKLAASSDDPNLVGTTGLAPVMALAGRAGLVAEQVTVCGPGDATAHLKVPALVVGMVAGADSIDDMDLLRHGGMGRLFSGVRAPSTLGAFLRRFTFGRARQFDAVAPRFLAALARRAPILRLDFRSLPARRAGRPTVVRLVFDTRRSRARGGGVADAGIHRATV